MKDAEIRKLIIDIAWDETIQDKSRILSLIDQMKDVNYREKNDDILLTKLISAYDYRLISIDFIKYIVSKGANVNYEEEGFNCLFNAVLTIKLELVAFLLEVGANPNCISTTAKESLLDWVEFDYWLEYDIDGHVESRGYEPIIEVLKQYGAKTYGEITNENSTAH